MGKVSKVKWTHDTLTTVVICSEFSISLSSEYSFQITVLRFLTFVFKSHPSAVMNLSSTGM